MNEAPNTPHSQTARDLLDGFYDLEGHAGLLRDICHLLSAGDETLPPDGAAYMSREGWRGLGLYGDYVVSKVSEMNAIASCLAKEVRSASTNSSLHS